MVASLIISVKTSSFFLKIYFVGVQFILWFYVNVYLYDMLFYMYAYIYKTNTHPLK